MDGVDAVDDRDAKAGPEGRLLIRIDHLVPGLRGVGIGESAATAEDRAEIEPRGGCRIDRVLLDLGHLTDLVVQGHLTQQCGHALVNGPGGVKPRTVRGWLPGPGRVRGSDRVRGTRGVGGDRVAAGRHDSDDRDSTETTDPPTTPPWATRVRDWHAYSPGLRRACSIAQIASGRRYIAARNRPSCRYASGVRYHRPRP